MRKIYLPVFLLIASVRFACASSPQNEDLGSQYKTLSDSLFPLTQKLLTQISLSKPIEERTMQLTSTLLQTHPFTWAPSSTSLGKIRQKYTQGHAPNRKEATGWFSGRCFSSLDPNTPENGILIGQFDGHNDGGPLFPSHFQIRAAHTEDYRAPSDYYDNLTQDKIADLTMLLASTHVTDAILDKNSLMSNNGKDNIRYRIRKNGPYLILRASVIKDNLYDLHINSGEADYYCYYFNKVRN